MKDEMWGNIIQLTGVLLLGAGVMMEIIMDADFWLWSITLGAVIFAIGTKIKGH